MHQNVDPFNMIFTDYFGSSVIPSLRDMVQRAIGVYQSGGPQVSDEQQPEETENITLQGEEPIPVPIKITLKWLIDHVPIKLWAMGVGLLVAAFLLGIKAASWEFVKEIIGAGNG